MYSARLFSVKPELHALEAAETQYNHQENHDNARKATAGQGTNLGKLCEAVYF
jgi:hypothetical protein